MKYRNFDLTIRTLLIVILLASVPSHADDSTGALEQKLQNGANQAALGEQQAHEKKVQAEENKEKAEKSPDGKYQGKTAQQWEEERKKQELQEAASRLAKDQNLAGLKKLQENPDAWKPNGHEKAYDVKDPKKYIEDSKKPNGHTAESLTQNELTRIGEDGKIEKATGVGQDGKIQWKEVEPAKSSPIENTPEATNVSQSEIADASQPVNSTKGSGEGTSPAPSSGENSTAPAKTATKSEAPNTNSSLPKEIQNLPLDEATKRAVQDAQSGKEAKPNLDGVPSEISDKYTKSLAKAEAAANSAPSATGAQSQEALRNYNDAVQKASNEAIQQLKAVDPSNPAIKEIQHYADVTQLTTAGANDMIYNMDKKSPDLNPGWAQPLKFETTKTAGGQTTTAMRLGSPEYVGPANSPYAPQNGGTPYAPVTSTGGNAQAAFQQIYTRNLSNAVTSGLTTVTSNPSSAFQSFFGW